MATPTWFSRHVSGALVTSVLCMYMMLGGLGCDRHWLRDLFHPSHHDKKAVSGTVQIHRHEKDCSEDYSTISPVANVVVRAFQWHIKDGVTLPTTYSDDDRHSDDAAKVNAKYGSWKLVAETVTNRKGHYAFKKGDIPTGYETFIEVLSISRPANGLPTTYIIANKEAELFNDKVHNSENQKPFYGKENQGDVCPEGEKCIKDNDGVYRYPSPSKLTKDDRIIYAMRKKLDGTEELDSAGSYYYKCREIPRISTWNYENGQHNGKDNYIVDFNLNQYEHMVPTPESWYKLSTYTPIYKENWYWIGTSVFDVLKFMNDTMLPRCKNNNSTIIDLHYYPAWHNTGLLHTFVSKSPAMPMPTELKQYATDHNHYYAALPPVMHLQPCLDNSSYSQKLEELLLNSELFPKGTKKDSNEKK